MPPLEQLAAPPIFEVICGVVFESIPGLDPLTLGRYWAAKRESFPVHQLHPALSDDPTILLSGIPPLRTWLISQDEDFVLQVQSDRFYLNWRARGREYPRFRDHGARKGIRSRLLDEFGHFSRFCEDEFGRTPSPTRIELAKVDQFVEAKHWDGFHDLAQLLPWLRAFATFSKTGDPGLAIRFGEQRPGGTLSVSADLGRAVVDGEQRRIVKLETRVSRSLVGIQVDVSEVFSSANTELNEVFASLIPEPQLSRFQ